MYDMYDVMWIDIYQHALHFKVYIKRTILEAVIINLYQLQSELILIQLQSAIKMSKACPTRHRS